MLRSLNSLERYKVTATDGDVGAVSDFLLDDHANAPDASPGRATTWAVRYLIVQTGGFFHRRRVLVSPISIHEVDAATRRFHLSLTVEKIRNSPNFDADKPVSRAHEREHSQYYQYPYYWGYSGLWGMGAVPGVLATAGDEEDPLGDDRPTEPGADAAFETAETHLRSARELLGYHVQTEEGVAGQVEDFLVDDETYEVRNLVVNTGHASVATEGGQRVLLAPAAVTRVSWEERNLYVSASRQAVVEGIPYERSERNVTADGDPADAPENLIETDTAAAHEAVGAAGGAIAGGILGAVAGPPGAAAGAVLGGIAGAVTEAALERGAKNDAARTREVDAQLGVSGGDIGAPNLRHPPAKRGVYTGASVGVSGSSDEVPAEGPIPPSR
jgi:sporulation protein YlmC with PRC-barrel domain